MKSLYKPLNETEVMNARYALLPDGEYDAVVTSSLEVMSKTGNVMADMMVKVFRKDGTSSDVRDFLVFTEKMLWKIKHFCDAAGLQKIYDAGEFTPANAVNRHVKVLIATRPGGEIPADKLNGKPAGSLYPDKNVIDDYVVSDTGSGKVSDDDLFQDKIPF